MYCYTNTYTTSFLFRGSHPRKVERQGNIVTTQRKLTYNKQVPQLVSTSNFTSCNVFHILFKSHSHCHYQLHPCGPLLLIVSLQWPLLSKEAKLKIQLSFLFMFPKPLLIVTVISLTALTGEAPPSCLR